MVWLRNTFGHEASENTIILDYLWFSYKKFELIYKIKRNVFGIHQVQISVQWRASLSRILIYPPSPIKEIKKWSDFLSSELLQTIYVILSACEI